MNRKERLKKKNERLGSRINGQFPLEEKVPWELLFFSIFRVPHLFFFFEKKKEKKCGEK